MKTLTVLGLASSLFFVSCSDAEKQETTNQDSTQVDTNAVAYAADLQASIVNWAGNTAGATIYGHFGTLKLTEGSLEIAGDKIAGGSFTIDMNSLTATDSAYKFTADNSPAALKGHLAAEEFFNIAAFPTATFKITSVEAGKVTGDMTIKGKTNVETIEFSDLVITDSEVKVTGKLVIDRQKYGVSWKHFLKDTVLSDEVPLTITLVAKK